MVCEEPATDAGVRVVSKTGSGRHCPVCSTPFLVAVMDDTYRIEIC